MAICYAAIKNELKSPTSNTNLRTFKSSTALAEMPPRFKFWIMHSTAFCLCLFPESNYPVVDLLVRKHHGTEFLGSWSLLTGGKLAVILEALKVEKSWEYCLDGEFYVRLSFSHSFVKQAFVGTDNTPSTIVYWIKLMQTKYRSTMQWMLWYFSTQNVMHLGISLKCWILDLTTNLLNQNLHFNKTLRWFVSTFKLVEHFHNTLQLK